MEGILTEKQHFSSAKFEPRNTLPCRNKKIQEIYYFGFVCMLAIIDF